MILSDIRYAFRSLVRAPGFAITVILTLGLGIGANTAIFSVVRGVLLKPLPHRGGDQLMYLKQSVNGPGGENIKFSVPEINDFRGVAKTLKGIAEFSPVTLTLEGENDAVRMQIGLVTGNYFSVMGLTVIRGRTLTDADDGTKVPPVAILTHPYWLSRFGGDTTIVGKSVRIDGRAVQIVGILEPAPFFPDRMDALMNMVISDHHTSAMMVQGRTHRMTDMIARLAPGATVSQARAEVATIRDRVQKDHADAYDAASNYRVTLTPFQEVIGERARTTLYLLMGAAAFVMIISCANVANLTLMRSVKREQELVVRAALGAGTARLRKLLLVENIVLAFMGAALGLVFARVGLGLLIAYAQRFSPRANEINLDGMVLGFTIALSLVVAVILSFAPKLAQEGSLGGWIAAGAARVSGSLKRQRLQRSLVVAQIAVSVMLLAGAGLLTRTMMMLSDVDSGLKAGAEVLTMEVPLGFNRNDTLVKSMYSRMQQELLALPGVKEVGVGSVMPLRAAGFNLDVKAEGRVLNAGEAIPRAEFRTVTPEYFRAAGIPVLKGREFLSTDRRATARVVILNKTLADKLFPDKDAVGQRVAWTGDVLRFIGVSGDWREVVGVVGDTKDGGLDSLPIPAVFMPFDQENTFTAGLVIRSDRATPGLEPAAVKVVRGVAPKEPIENILTVDEIKDQSVAPRRLNAALLSSFSILAVIIAAVGIAGVLAFSVSTRTNEIGIRMSLGSTSGQVQGMILKEGGVLLAIGLALGVAGSLFAMRLLRGMLFGVNPSDPMTLGAVALGMAAIGLAACWLPARRASKVDPAITIRSQ